MQRFAMTPLLFMLMTLGASAQTDGQAPANPLSTWLRNAYTNNKNNILRTAERMPEENYDMRPGPQQEVRTFGQQVGHLANYDYLWCSQAKGEKNPNAGKNLEKLTTKAEFIKAVTDAFAYCDGVYAGLTDASGTEVIEITQENGRQNHIPRMALLILNFAHNDEIYGSMVSYLRMKGITPPASEPRPQKR